MSKQPMGSGPLSILLVSITASIMILCRACFGFQFPVPWPDETGFVSPAYNLAFTGSLFDAGMNPDRIVMWMPPGYMVLLAGAFRVFGYSFALVRWISAGFVLASLALAAAAAWRTTTGWGRLLAIGIVAGAFASPDMLMSGNIGRMESLFCFLMLLALSAALADRLYVMTALLGFGALVHPNAIYFLPIVPIVFVARASSGTLRLPGRGGWIALAACAAAGCAYAALIATHWSGFLADMRFQFAFKRLTGGDPLYPLWVVYIAVGLFVWRAVLAKRFDSSTVVALFGVGFVAMANQGHEIWYDYGQQLGFALLAVACLSAAPAPWSTRTRVAALLPAALSGAMALAFCIRTTPILKPLLPTTAMLTRSVVPSSDIEKVRRFISTLKSGDTVDFGWTGMECFFLDDLRRVGARYTIVRHSVTQVLPLRPSTWRVACDSDEFPKLLFKFDLSFKRQGLKSGCDILPGLAQPQG